MGRYDSPELGKVVHFVAEDGHCHAGFVVEVGQWVTMSTEARRSYDKSEGRAIRTAEQWFYGDAVALAVVNRDALAFRSQAECRHGEGSEQLPGTWHWPNPR